MLVARESATGVGGRTRGRVVHETSGALDHELPQVPGLLRGRRAVQRAAPNTRQVGNLERGGSLIRL